MKQKVSSRPPRLETAMKLLRQITIAAIMFSLLTTHSLAAEPVILDVFGNKCIHGLHPQPNGGPFSVFVFCDDALGSNIGIILTERGAGPGNMKLTEKKVWSKWDTDNRFWQDRIWAADVINLAWSPSQRYLYVATSDTYGDGGFFKIDLLDHTFQRLMVGSDVPYKPQLAHGYYTRIVGIDLKTGEITVAVSHSKNGVLVATEVLPFE